MGGSYIKGKKDMVLKRLIFSYMGILAIFIVFFMMIYGGIQYNIEKQMVLLNEITLKSFQNEMDKRIVAVNTTGVSLIWDNLILDKINKSNGETKGEAAYATYQVKKQLESYRKSNNYISDIYIYIKENDFVISSHTAAGSKQFYKSNIDALQSSYTEWIDKISDSYNGDYWSYYTKDGKEEISLSYSLPVKAYGENGAHATMVLLLSEGIFKNNALEFCSLNGVSLDIKIKNMDLNYFQGKEVRPVFKTISTDSEIKGITYSVHIPKNIYRKQQNILIFFLISCFLVYMFVSVTFIITSIRRNYNPLRDLIDDIKNTVNNKENTNVGEYLYLRNAFHKVMEQQLANEKLITRQMEHLVESYLVQLLTGSLRTSDVYKNHVDFLKEFLYSRYAIILIKQMKGTDHILNIERIGIQHKKGESLLQGICVKIGQAHVVLVNGQDLTREAWKEKINQVWDHLSQESDGYNMAVSTLHKISKGIHKVYYEMVYILQCMESSGKINAIAFEENFERRYFSWYSKEDEIRLKNAIQSLDIDRTIMVLNDMWESAAGKGGLTMDEAKFLLIGQMNILYKSTKEICPALYWKGIPIKYHVISQLDNREEIKEMLINTVKIIIEQMKGHTYGQEADNIVNSAVLYVDKNYADVNLSVEKLCSTLGRSVSNVSKAFREYRQESILYYINYRRVQEAKQIIKKSKGEILMNDLYARVGFGSINTFIRAFKKYEGITPGSYVEIIKSQKND